MKRWNLLHWSRLAVALQFLALIRTLAEYFRLKFATGDALNIAAADPLVLGALVASIFTALGVAANMTGRYRWSIAFAVMTVMALLGIKLALVG